MFYCCVNMVCRCALLTVHGQAGIFYYTGVLRISQGCSEDLKSDVSMHMYRRGTERITFQWIISAIFSRVVFYNRHVHVHSTVMFTPLADERLRHIILVFTRVHLPVHACICSRMDINISRNIRCPDRLLFSFTRFYSLDLIHLIAYMCSWVVFLLGEN